MSFCVTTFSRRTSFYFNYVNVGKIYIYDLSVRSSVFTVELYTVVDDVDEHYMKQTKNIYIFQKILIFQQSNDSDVLGILLLMLIIT